MKKCLEYKLQKAILKGIDESFDINDMCNRIDTTSHTKKSVGKHPRMLESLKRFVEDHKDGYKGFDWRCDKDDIELLCLAFDEDIIDETNMVFDGNVDDDDYDFLHLLTLVYKAWNDIAFNRIDRVFVNNVLAGIDSKSHPLYGVYMVFWNDQVPASCLCRIPSYTTAEASKCIFNGIRSINRIIDKFTSNPDYFGPDCNLNWLDVYGVCKMDWLFRGLKFNGDISLWNLRHVESMSMMFKESQFNGDISRWNVSNVRDFHMLFKDSQFTGDISEWNVKHYGAVTARMFDNCPIPYENRPKCLKGQTVRDYDGRTREVFESFDINDMGNRIDNDRHRKQSVEKHSKLYGLLKQFISDHEDGYDGFDWHCSKDDIEMLCIAFGDDVVEDVSKLIYDSIDENDRHFLRLLTLVYKAANSRTFSEIDRIFVDEVLSKIKDKSHPLYGCYQIYDANPMFVNGSVFDEIRSIAPVVCQFTDSGYFGPLCNLNWMDVSGVSNMYEVFTSLEFDGDISLWDVSNVINAEDMFHMSRFTGDISGWQIKSLKNMSGMFSMSCFDGDISGWDVSGVEEMSYAFSRADYFECDLSGWKVNPECDVYGMFYDTDFDKKFLPNSLKGNPVVYEGED